MLMHDYSTGETTSHLSSDEMRRDELVLKSRAFSRHSAEIRGMTMGLYGSVIALAASDKEPTFTAVILLWPPVLAVFAFFVIHRAIFPRFANSLSESEIPHLYMDVGNGKIKRRPNKAILSGLLRRERTLNEFHSWAASPGMQLFFDVEEEVILLGLAMCFLGLVDLFSVGWLHNTICYFLGPESWYCI